MRLKLSIEEKEELRRLQRNVVGTPDYVRITCILMFDNGRSSKNISEDLGISVATIYRYVGDYQLGGIDELNRIGFTYKKTTEVPCEADAEKQAEFAKELAEILIAKDDKTVVYYADGVHPTHNSRSTYGWIEKGKQFEQPTVSGRDSVNINGLLNAYDVTDVIAHNCESVNAQSTHWLYEAALAKHPDASCIYIISDNARYYHNKELKLWAEGTKIKQIFLPPYSQNLNLIELLWRFLRKKVINTGFYRTKEEFKIAIRRFFDNIADFREELESLLTLKFRLFNSQTVSF